MQIFGLLQTLPPARWHYASSLSENIKMGWLIFVIGLVVVGTYSTAIYAAANKSESFHSNESWNNNSFEVKVRGKG